MNSNPAVSPTGPEKENIPATPKPKRLSIAQQKIADAAVAAAAERALVEIELLKEQLEASNRVCDAAQEAMWMAETQGPGPDQQNNLILIIKPKGEAEAMDLEGDTNKDLYEAIQCSIKRGAYKAGIDFSADYRPQDVEQLAAVFEYVRKHHPYMTRNCFPADWAAGEMLK
ncbi:hypothetical protein FIBSPDRAFT_900978 [Athelia psychrophila]|uniref:Uncharacterized protein n=1 Tax=Athelia psychrophila TaxID=1759441 RepID=A0A165XRP1_9AGAM|nr:hypothetical protein FIBSPDRAFT_900978 [Fibularhizoctonia sp. CBS 109695]